MNESTHEAILDPRMLEQMRRIRGGPGGFLAELVSLFISESALRAVAVADAIARRDAEGGAAAAHALRGSSATFGAEHLARLCKQVEDACEVGDLATAGSIAQDLQSQVAVVAEQLATLP